MGFFDRWKKSQMHYADGGLANDRAVYIRSLVEHAGKVDGRREVFGSARHQYKLNPVISPEKVSEYETKYHVELPEEYKFFLTKVGNGGAGPYYGLYSLEELRKYHEHIMESGNPAWINDTLTPDNWAERMNTLDDVDDQTYDQLMLEICSGFNVIGTQGCTYDNLLMNSGSEKGKIVYIDWNLLPDGMPYLTGMSFLDWYEKFFLEIINGNTVNSYGYIRLGTEEELILAYQKATPEEQLLIVKGFYRFSKVNEKTKKFLLDIDNKALDAMRTELLFRFDLEDGIKLFETLLSGTNQQAAIMCARRMPETHFDRYYEQMLYLLYHLDMPYEKAVNGSCKQKLLYFLGDCKRLKAKDLAEFTMDPNCIEDERKTAICVMGKAGDKINCLEYFIEFMKSDSYWIAHSALQAVARTACPELMETYEWMWDKYKDDKIMHSNLIIAFQTNGVMKGDS